MGVLLVVLGLGPGTSLRADGISCEEAGGRRANAAELAFLRRFHEVVSKRFPTAPQGWEQDGPGSFEESGAEDVCVQPDSYPFQKTLTARYRKVEGEEARQQAMFQVMERIQRAPQEDPKILEEKMKEISGRMEAVIARGDYQAIEKLQQELQAAMAPMQARGEQMGKELQQAEAENYRDTEASVSVSLNPSYGVDEERFREFDLTGAPHALEILPDPDDPPRQRTQSTMVALLGTWTRALEEGVLRLQPPEPGPGTPTRILTIKVEVEAVPARGMEMLRAMRVGKLLEDLRR